MTISDLIKYLLTTLKDEGDLEVIVASEDDPRQLDPFVSVFGDRLYL